MRFSIRAAHFGRAGSLPRRSICANPFFHLADKPLVVPNQSLHRFMDQRRAISPLLRQLCCPAWLAVRAKVLLPWRQCKRCFGPMSKFLCTVCSAFSGACDRNMLLNISSASPSSTGASKSKTSSPTSRNNHQAEIIRLSLTALPRGISPTRATNAAVVPRVIKHGSCFLEPGERAADNARRAIHAPCALWRLAGPQGLPDRAASGELA